MGMGSQKISYITINFMQIFQQTHSRSSHQLDQTERHPSLHQMT